MKGEKEVKWGKEVKGWKEVKVGLRQRGGGVKGRRR